MVKRDRAISQLLRRITTPVALFALASSLAVSLHSSAATGQSRTRVEGPSRESLTMEERIAYQRAIEEAYWRHRIWPKDNAKPKPALDQVVPPSALRAKVEDYLQKSWALAEHRQRPITGEELQAEIERMARQTKRPEMLRELWAALGNDPYVIAECLARPALAEELISFYRETQTDDTKIGDRLQIAQQNTNLLAAPTRADLVPVTDFRPGLAVSRKKLIRESYTRDQQDPREPKAPVRRMSRQYREKNAGGVDRFHLAADFNQGSEEFNVPNLEQREESIDIQLRGELEEPEYDYQLEPITSASGGCVDDTWTRTSTTYAPSARAGHLAVWTGSEMIVWGGGYLGLVNTGGRYDPATDSWKPTSVMNAPSARNGYTVVWTGSEMIVWGGSNLATGGRYNPATDTWTPTSTTNAPSARYGHTAVWTGTEMIVWGGSGPAFPEEGTSTGGRYDPDTDSWKPTSMTRVAGPRSSHTAVWTGTQMIVWGGIEYLTYLNTGGRYDPATDSWMATNTANAPSARWSYTAVWTVAEMIVWGGYDGDRVNTGGRYDPATDRWRSTDTANAPSARVDHTAVWTGAEMIVWGGAGSIDNFDSGGRYDPAIDNWRTLSTNNAPHVRPGHTTVWTGTEMIVWGGLGSTGAGDRYCAFLRQLFFPQLAFGGGFSTNVHLINHGPQSAIAAVKIVDASGAAVPLPRGVLPDSGSLSISSGGMATLPIMGTDGLTTAWGLVESFGKLTGVAIYESSVAGTPSTLVGVEGTQPTQEAIIPIDNSAAADRYTGMAIVNHSQEDLNIRLAIVNENGITVDTIAPPELNPLKAQKQLVRFLHEFTPALSTFRGSVVLTAGGNRFVVVALVQVQGKLTAIPVLSRH